MAEDIIREVVSVIVEKLASRPIKQVMVARDIDSQIQRLLELKTTIDATLLDAYSLVSCTNAQQNVLDKLSCALAKFDHFLDEKAARAKQQETLNGNKFIKTLRLFFSSSNQLVSSLRDAHKLKAILNKFECIAKYHDQFGTIIGVPSGNQTLAVNAERSSSHFITDMIIGRESDKENIVNKLFDDYVASETPLVTSIVGIGGVGKTTLARYVYHDDRVKSFFDVQFWFPAPDDFNVNDVLKMILEANTDELFFSSNMDKLHDNFLRVIMGKKYLLVLDDVWEHDGLRLKWLRLRSLLAFGAKGSKVLITTRSQIVAGIMDSIGHYILGDLTEHNSWLLFQKIAFTQWQEPGVEVIGKEIIGMCPNVPLVILSIGDLLAGKHTLQQWKAFRDNQLANFSSYGQDIIHTLKLSYDHLDKRLKLCVSYCSLFPKGFRYDKYELIRLWISLGYVEPQYENQSLEEAGEAYVLNLVNCGFFQYDGVTGLIMHNLMHDLVLSIAGCKYKMADSNTDDFDKRVCHVAFCTWPDTSREVPSSFFQIEHLQSFLLTVPWHTKITLKDSFFCERLITRFSSLRVLDLHDLGIKNVPRSVGELLSLRYLNLSWNPIVKLPSSITRLINLLSLDLSWCYKLKELPKKMCKLKKLRHIHVLGCEKLSHMPTGFGNLQDLRSLDTFIVRQQDSRSESKSKAAGGLAELNRLSNLAGWLKICMFGGLKDAANLKSMDKLTALHLEFKDGSANDNKMMLEGLQINTQLRELDIEGYAGEQFPFWVRNQLHLWLPNLVKLWIYKCESCKSLCSFGRLPHLKSILLGKLENVEYIEDTRDGSSNEIMNELDRVPLFPSLETLMLISMPKLKAWQRIISHDQVDSRSPTYNLQEPRQAFPRLKGMWVDNMELIISITREFRGFSSLEELTVAKCENVKAIPHCIALLSNLKKLTLKNCSKKLKERCQKPTGEDWPKIQHIPNIIYIGCK